MALTSPHTMKLLHVAMVVTPLVGLPLAIHYGGRELDNQGQKLKRVLLLNQTIAKAREEWEVCGQPLLPPRLPGETTPKFSLRVAENKLVAPEDAERAGRHGHHYVSAVFDALLNIGAEDRSVATRIRRLLHLKGTAAEDALRQELLTDGMKHALDVYWPIHGLHAMSAARETDSFVGKDKPLTWEAVVNLTYVATPHAALLSTGPQLPDVIGVFGDEVMRLIPSEIKDETPSGTVRDWLDGALLYLYY